MELITVAAWILEMPSSTAWAEPWTNGTNTTTKVSEYMAHSSQ